MVATLTRVLGPRRLDLAEEVVQDAMMRALETWPYRGIPHNPEGWLMRVAHNRAIDLLRRESFHDTTVVPELTSALAAPANIRPASVYGAAGAGIEVGADTDDLAMVLMCCHPDIPAEARVALTLRTVGGFGVREIARAFLLREDAVAQRLVRAKRRIREQNIQLEIPASSELAARLDSVLDVLYLMFNEGYAATEGDLIRAELCREAIRLAAQLAAHPATDLPEVHALLALMLFQASRLGTRLGEDGGLLLLSEQDRTRWDQHRVHAALRHLDVASCGERLTRYHIEAGIAACHAVAPSWEDTDWPRILDLYDALLAVNPSPVVALNRAVAVSMVHGPGAALILIRELEAHSGLERYFLLPATAGDLYERIGDLQAAKRRYECALTLPCSTPEKAFLQRRIAALQT